MLSRRRILILDDNAANLAVLAELLRQSGCVVDSARDAAAAVEQARMRAPELLITDLRMPGTCGYAAAWMVRSACHRPDLPVIAASASPLPEAEDTAALGFDAFLLKPIELTQLAAALIDCLGTTASLGTDSADTQSLEQHDPAPARSAEDPEADSDADALDAGAAVPPALELADGAELAAREDWDALRDWCTDLACGEPAYAPFARRILALAARVETDRAHADYARLRALLDTGEEPAGR